MLLGPGGSFFLWLEGASRGGGETRIAKSELLKGIFNFFLPESPKKELILWDFMNFGAAIYVFMVDVFG